MGSTNDGDKSRAIQLTEAIDWAFKGAAAGKYGEVNTDYIGAAGQSCGGVEAYSASVLEPRVKVVGIYNTGVIDPGRRWYLKEMKQPIGITISTTNLKVLNTKRVLPRRKRRFLV
jgi:hypothetical protein